MRWKRNSEPIDKRPYRVKIADWIEGGCDPTSPDAPNFQTLEFMEREGLIKRTESTGTAWWELTPLGEYEIERQRAGGKPPWNGIL